VAVLRGDFDRAEEDYRAAIRLGSTDADVFNNLAAILSKRGVKKEERAELLGRAYDLDPGNEEIRKNHLRILDERFVALFRAGLFREALAMASRRVEIEPSSAAYQRDLGYCYSRMGKPHEAIKYFTRAINLCPDNADYYNDLGLVYFELRLLAEASGAFQEVLRLSPNSVAALTHLGLLANLTGLTELAVTFLRRALDAAPDCAEAENNVALLLRDQGEQVECRQHYQRAIRLKPDDTNAFSGYLLALNDDPNLEPEWVAEQHRRFQSLIRRDVRDVRPSDRDPARRLRIGYLSPDFRSHSVAFFVVPLLGCHDREVVDVTCYSTGLAEDDVTRTIRASVSTFRNVYRMADCDLAQQIRDDRIDILVELSGHTAENRLLMLGGRVAPLQLTYLGYPNTTGLVEMDYRVTDDVADPVGCSESLHTEKLGRIDGGFLAYQPMKNARELPVVDLPAGTAGYVTFGSFNNLAKINEVVLDTWAAILQRVPDSRLLLKARGLGSDGVRARIAAAFAVRGVEAAKRVELMGHELFSVDHLQVYNRVDIALDTFPYNGTTTTCEALWMGTPVVTFEGRCHAGRVGASILTHAGLAELVAQDRQGYIDRAVSLGKDLEETARVRRGLRERFARSAVMDAGRLARGLEKLYREAWIKYCSASS
jgi:predicted O-linked N-acetylglucosamine transferase (SPINDLY family)